MSKIYFQGTFGAYSHLAALEIDPKAEIVPCKTFDECFLKASLDSGSRIVIPESNRITGNIGIEYLIFKYRLNIYEEYQNTFFPTIYTICPDKTLFQSGPISFDQHVAGAFAPCSNLINGCTDPTASNYDTDAAEDDGSCIYSTLDYDGNGDGCVNGEDVLNILVEYGSCE